MAGSSYRGFLKLSFDALEPVIGCCSGFCLADVIGGAIAAAVAGLFVHSKWVDRQLQFVQRTGHGARLGACIHLGLGHRSALHLMVGFPFPGEPLAALYVTKRRCPSLFAR